MLMAIYDIGGGHCVPDGTDADCDDDHTFGVLCD